MFTGLIETIGSIQATRARGNYLVLDVASNLPTDEIVIGESIACNGVCLTVVSKAADRFAVEASQETIARVGVERFGRGKRLNLERALQLGGRLGGHLVAGHVDDTGRIDYLRPVGESLELAVEFDKKFDPLVVDKGSICIEGVSLTVNAVRSGWLSVNLIPHTGGATTLTELKSGDSVNLEFDLIGKYVAKMQLGRSGDKLSADLLIESGW